MFRCAIGCVGFAALVLAPAAFAHHPSGASSAGGTGPIATMSAATLEQGMSAAAMMFEMVKIDAISDARLKAFADQHIHAHSLDAILAPTLVYAYGVTSDLTVIARLPYIVRRDVREGQHSHGPAGNTVDERGDAAGIGDLTLLGQYRFFNDRVTRTEAALLVGVKTPTGRTNIHDSLGERFEAEFQPGSGSWDGLFGLAFTQRVAAWSFDANVLYQQVNKGEQATDLGDRFFYNAAVSFRLTGGPMTSAGRMNAGAMPEPMYHGGPRDGGHRHTHPESLPAAAVPALDLVLELNGEWHARQDIGGVKDENSGGNLIYLSPGIRVSSGGWSSFASVGIPVVNRVNGVQAEPDWRLLTGLAVGF